MRYKKLTAEGIVKQQVKYYLKVKGWHVRQIMQSALSDHGLPDLFAFKAGRVIFVECKSPKGRQSDRQKAFQQELEAEGCMYILVSSVDNLVGMGI